MADANVQPEPCVFSLLSVRRRACSTSDAVKENVDGLFHVAALDDHGARAALDDFARRRFHRGVILDRNSGKNFSFGDIRRYDRRALQQFFAQDI